MPKVALAHDYFLQMGGAERVASAWLAHYTESTIHTLAYASDATFDSIDPLRVHSKLHGSVWVKTLHKTLPLLPKMAHSVKVKEGDVALVSTSGWAHQFQYDIPVVAYVHSPARWLYAAEDYRLGLSAIPRIGLRLSSKYLIHRDKSAMRRMDRLVSNSKVTQARIWKAYGRDSEVVSPPVTAIEAIASRPKAHLPNQFLLIVARNRGYKRIGAAADIARRAGRALVVIGGGTKDLHCPPESIYGLGRVTDGELKWLYQHADALLATAKEDFGLTVLEANAEGTPVVAVPFGGYLETVKPGINGALSASENMRSFGPALEEALCVSSVSCVNWAARFSLANHIKQLESVMHDVSA